ncbi:diguanylate cyclase (GGDEF) domain-containing protein [Oceanospirillum multiglobuliferum]|uniref:GGDEF domain-containing protein n=1 Tax=Oceanospirillum multiglobuliferum TaxID=64969 RepID=A0A1T4S6P8_9GAMM|nr:sensor domain-containing diguanylate cyclase [Oceanospirillum multiglobuliferum]OPX54425.1 GGDEF domain-containing protein [Oceanospirillum multiglobuliferum]SKA23934.1 diguanylate cyclase (GGDEF) domain-containing protein [Oceanospirillum multiglobuliferum]
MSEDFSQLPVFLNHQEIAILEHVPDIIWIFDLDRHGFWWGNSKALAFWGLTDVEQLIAKDLSADTESARKRTEQTFYKAVAEGMTEDPWTTYPNGKPKMLLMRHKAVLLGPEQHRGIVAYISENVSLSEQPEQLLFAEAVRYTPVAVTNFSMAGEPLFENPSSAKLYGFKEKPEHGSTFVSRFLNPDEGLKRLAQGQAHQDGSEEHLMMTRKGPRRHTVDIRTSRHPITGDYVLLVSEYDVTALREALTAAEDAQKALERLAHYDTLTGLAVTHLCKARLSQATLSAQRDQHQVALLFIDLDGFKAVNDQYGHSCGDQVLVEVAQRLQSITRDTDTLARIGGDEFLVLQTPIHSKREAEALATQILEVLAAPFPIQTDIVKLASTGTTDVHIGASIGIALYPEIRCDSDEMIKKADHAMYRVKRSGKNGYCYA